MLSPVDKTVGSSYQHGDLTHCDLLKTKRKFFGISDIWDWFILQSFLAFLAFNSGMCPSDLFLTF